MLGDKPAVTRLRPLHEQILGHHFETARRSYPLSGVYALAMVSGRAGHPSTRGVLRRRASIYSGRFSKSVMDYRYGRSGGTHPVAARRMAYLTIKGHPACSADQFGPDAQRIRSAQGRTSYRRAWMSVEHHQAGAVGDDLPNQPLDERPTITDFDIRVRLASLSQPSLDRGCQARPIDVGFQSRDDLPGHALQQADPVFVGQTDRVRAGLGCLKVGACHDRKDRPAAGAGPHTGGMVNRAHDISFQAGVGRVESHGGFEPLAIGFADQPLAIRVYARETSCRWSEIPAHGERALPMGLSREDHTAYGVMIEPGCAPGTAYRPATRQPQDDASPS